MTQSVSQPAVTQRPVTPPQPCFEPPTKSKAQQQQEELEALKRELAEENAQFERQHKSKAQQQQEELEALKRKLAEENAQFERQQQPQQNRQDKQKTWGRFDKKSSGDCGRSSSGSSDDLQPVEVTQSPESDIGTVLGLKYFIILEQPNRKFSLSDDQRNLYIMNPEETNIRVYQPSFHSKLLGFLFIDKFEPETKWHEESGKYLNGARMVSTSVDNLENPSLCQVKISGMTKTYKFEKIIRIEV